MAKLSLAEIIKRDFSTDNPKPVEQARQSGGLADLAGDDLIVTKALRRFETAKERATRQRAELDARVKPQAERTVPKTLTPDLTHLNDAELTAYRDALFAEEASQEVDGYFALSPEERAAVVPDMDEDELADYLDRPAHSFGFDEEESYEDEDES